MAHLRVTPLSCFHFSFFSLCFFFFFSFKYIFIAMWCPDDVERESWDWVGTPAWEREHDSTPQSGVEAPRLLKRSLPRLDYCRCWCWWAGVRAGGRAGRERERERGVQRANQCVPLTIWRSVRWETPLVLALCQYSQGDSVQAPFKKDLHGCRANFPDGLLPLTFSFLDALVF